jgi:signal transduction histidine kinase
MHEGERAVMVVQDHGIGVEPERLPHIFDRFERGVSQRHYGGLGLGLYIVRGIVEKAGGNVRCESILGAGAKFVVSLPREPVSALHFAGGDARRR